MAGVPAPPPLPSGTPEPQPIPAEVSNPTTERTSLLESIRTAGGIGRYPLKRARERNLPEKTPNAKIDLMGDLKNSLRGRGRGGGGRNVGAFGGGRGGMLAMRGGLKPSGRGLRK